MVAARVYAGLAGLRWQLRVPSVEERYAPLSARVRSLLAFPVPQEWVERVRPLAIVVKTRRMGRNGSNPSASS